MDTKGGCDHCQERIASVGCHQLAQIRNDACTLGLELFRYGSCQQFFVIRAHLGKHSAIGMHAT